MPWSPSRCRAVFERSRERSPTTVERTPAHSALIQQLFFHLTRGRSGVAPRDAASLLGHRVATHIAFYLPTSNEAAETAAKVAGGLFTAAK